MIRILVFFISFLFLLGCNQGQTQSKNQLSAKAFQEKLKQSPNAVLIDVRTPEEFAKGHLVNAKNIDWNGNDFEKRVAVFDKTKPTFVYCLAGSRSEDAAENMRLNGFETVFELSGGILKWRAANLPETTIDNNLSRGMNMKAFEEKLSGNKLILVDFYADWCAPCKKMKPFLDEISKDMGDKVEVIRINYDDNQELCKALKIDEIPVLCMYKNQQELWCNVGFLSKQDILKQIKIHSN